MLAKIVSSIEARVPVHSPTLYHLKRWSRIFLHGLKEWCRSFLHIQKIWFRAFVYGCQKVVGFFQVGLFSVGLFLHLPLNDVVLAKRHTVNISTSQSMM